MYHTLIKKKHISIVQKKVSILMNALQEINMECSMLFHARLNKNNQLFLENCGTDAGEMGFRAEMTTFFKRFSCDLFLDESKTITQYD